MQAKLEPYNGSGKKVVVYNTYADKGRLHFDVFIPTDKSQSTQVPKEIDSEAVGYAKEFLTLIGKPSDDISVNMCERCHIDNTDLYASELWNCLARKYLFGLWKGAQNPPEFFLCLMHIIGSIMDLIEIRGPSSCAISQILHFHF